ncbi:MAG: 1-acyl-sn-glycerol-3-phosphate acyltransferase [Planctomycetes bacterium]|nr:1-acyl-sn-glycerol-3-phosphate acyltransferase [Planctomycetota bacterium]
MSGAPANGPDDRRAAPPGRGSNALFWPFWLGCRCLLRVWFRLRIVGAPPAHGAYVLAANHTSFVDPIVLGASLRRRVVFLMTEVVYRSRSLGWFFRWNRAIPVSPRAGNRDAMRAARAVLQQGRVVGIFPEGGLSRDGLPMRGNPGAVSLVLNEGVPIVPVGIDGAGAAFPPGARWPRPRRITVAFGEPILPAQLDALGGGDRRARLQAATRLIMDRIAALNGQLSREAELAARAAGDAPQA